MRNSRRAAIEALEPRQVLAGPTLAPLADLTVAKGNPLYGGAPMNIALNGFDADGDALTYTVSITNATVPLTAVIPEGNPSLRISVDSDQGGGPAGIIHGDMVFELFEDLAPRTVGRISELAGAGFYDGLTFHRVIRDYWIQGGDPLGTGSGGSGERFDDEYEPSLQYTSAGVLATANRGDDTNDCQFFITANPTRWLDFNWPIFGFLTEGDDLRKKIEAVPIENDFHHRPVHDVVMTNVEVFTDTQNRVLRLSAPHGATGEADVTVTVNDGHGGTANRAFHVSVRPDTGPYSDSPPFLGPMPAKFEARAGTAPFTYRLSATDVEGDPVVYGASPNNLVTIDPQTGLATITPPATPGEYTLTFEVRPLGGGVSYQRDTQSVRFVVGAPEADLSITVTDGRTQVTPGQQITYTIVVTNNGPSAVANALVVDVFPATLTGVTFTASATGGAMRDSSATWGDINETVDMPSGSTITYTVQATVAASATGAIVNTAVVVAPSGAIDAAMNNNTATDADEVLPPYSASRILALGADAGSTSQPLVKVLDAQTGQVLASFLAYESGFRGGVRVAVGDLDGDAQAEIVTAPGRGRAPLVKVFSVFGRELPQYRFTAYAAGFLNGVQLAVADVTGDGRNDVVTVPSRGPAEVRVFENRRAANPADPFDDRPWRAFLAFPSTFLGGATLAAADMTGDHRAEVIVGSGPGMRATVRVFNVAVAASAYLPIKQFYPTASTFRGGVTVSAGRVNGDAVPEVIVSAGGGGASTVVVLDGRRGTVLGTFSAFGGASQGAAVRAVGKDLDGDGLIDQIFAAQGPDGRVREVRRFRVTGQYVDRVLAVEAALAGGLFLG